MSTANNMLIDFDQERANAFRGNINLKRKGVVHQWTKEEIRELKICQYNVVHFINNYCKVIDIDKGIVPFELYDYQRKFVKMMKKQRFVVASWSRQSGKSSCVAAFFLWYVLFNEHKTCAILANKADSAREIMGRIQLMYEMLPSWLQQGIIDWNKGSFLLENGSRIICSPTSSSAIRGKSISLLYLDEFAFVPKNIADEFMTSVYPTISSGKESKIFITSTPFGLNHFYKIWNDAVLGRNGYAYIQAKWDVVPGRGKLWKKETIKNIGEEAFLQEYEIEFIGSAGTLIDPKVLKRLTYKDPIYSTNDLKVYEEPIKGHTYITTVDCSEGLGLDYSALCVIDVTSMPYKQILVYRSNMIDPHMLPEIIYNIANKYNSSKVLCELNSTGIVVTKILWEELEYENMLWCSTLKMRQVLGTAGTTLQRGLKTSILTKRIGCTVLKSLIENDQLIINDYDTLQELYAFARKNNTYQAQEGNNDDTVACLFLFGWMTKQTEFQKLLELDYRNPDSFNIRFRLKTDLRDEVDSLIAPMPIITNGVDELSPEERSKQFHNPDPFSFFNIQ